MLTAKNLGDDYRLALVEVADDGRGFGEQGGGTGIGAAGGIPEGGSRRQDRRLHAYDALTGRPLWSVDVSTLDPRLDETVVRGPAVIEGDTAVVAMRKANMSRRVSALYLVGVDLYSGHLRWARLVSSVGTNPWGRMSTRPEAITLRRGIAYRADDMGVVAAYEAGRIDEQTIDTAYTRVERVLRRAADTLADAPKGFDVDGHHALARQAAEQAIVDLHARGLVVIGLGLADDDTTITLTDLGALALRVDMAARAIGGEPMVWLIRLAETPPAPARCPCRAQSRWCRRDRASSPASSACRRSPR